MRRTALMAVALAVVALAGASNAQTRSDQTGPSTKTQRKLSERNISHAAHRSFHSAGHSTGRGGMTHAKSYSNGRASLSATPRRLTPDEAGREAGLAILRRREGAQVSRRTVRVVHRHSTRRVRLERAAWRSEESRATQGSESGEAAGEYTSPETGRAETDEAQNAESQRMGTDRETMPAASPAEANEAGANDAGANEAGDSADAGTGAVERMTPSEAAAERTADAAQNIDEGAATALKGETTSAAGAKARNDIASLVIPRSGMPLPLRGSLASLERQNDRLEAEGLERIEDEADLASRIADKLLVAIPVSSALTVNPDLEENHRYCRPWTAKFLADLARAHEAAFHRSIEVSSAVRTVEYQKRLERTNGNAAPAEGDLVSPHLTGATIDIAKKGLSRAEMAWMRRQLMGLEALGKIDVEEEFKQACFHITVYKNYAPAGKTGPVTPAKPVAGRTRRLRAEPVAAQGA